MGQLDGRVAIVTGAGLGIGRAIAKRYIEEGARVIVAELKSEPGELAAKELGENACFVQTDAGDKASVENMVQATVEHFGSVDILVNNAWGGGRIGRIENKTVELMNRALGVGFLGPFWAMVAAHPIMKAKGWGRIVNICSLNGVNAHMGTAEYNTSKEALRAATRTAAREWAGDGITANVICPAAKSQSFANAMSQHPELIGTIRKGAYKVRALGSIAIHMRDVAVGATDAFVGGRPTRSHLHDLAPGTLLIREAGGIVSDGRGADALIERKQVIAASPLVHDWLCTILPPASQA
jgi:NAD(P)-dependent dehydrogenase (short-subunit alcohol dehydrogenase family)